MNVSGISVLNPDQINFVNAPIGSDSSNQYSASSAEIKVDNALDALSQVRADIGAQTVSLGEDANNGTLTGINLTDAESRIRDADIGRYTTDFTKNQLIAQVGMGILSQVGVDAKLVTSLLLESIKAA